MHKVTYENKLNAAGFEKIGSGLYSNVFAKPNSDKVIKVGRIGDDWPAYIKWATENGYAGNFAPKVFDLKFRKDYYIAVMERLVATMREFIDDGENTDQYQLYSEFRSGDRKELEATDFVAFYELLKNKRWAGDLHDKNVMVRADGQLVIIDPSASDRGSEPFRIRSGVVI